MNQNKLFRQTIHKDKVPFRQTDNISLKSGKEIDGEPEQYKIATIILGYVFRSTRMVMIRVTMIGYDLVNLFCSYIFHN